MPGQPVVLGRGVEQQRVVALPPLVADAGVLVQDDAGVPGLPRKYAVARPVWPAPTMTVPTRLSPVEVVWVLVCLGGSSCRDARKRAMPAASGGHPSSSAEHGWFVCSR